MKINLGKKEVMNLNSSLIHPDKYNQNYASIDLNYTESERILKYGIESAFCPVCPYYKYDHFQLLNDGFVRLFFAYNN